MGMELYIKKEDRKFICLYQSPIWVWNIRDEYGEVLIPAGINLLYGYGTRISGLYLQKN